MDPWHAAMSHGEFEEAWRISDRVLRERVHAGIQCHDWPRHEQFVWRGEPLAGQRVLVRCYHGLGDTIQFIRFARQLRDVAREVIVWVQPALMELVARVDGVDRVLPLHDGTIETDFDVDIEVMELAHALRVRPEPAQVPYLFPRRGIRDDAERRPRHDRDVFTVGLVWQAGDWDPRRSVPTGLLSRLARVPGVRLFSLQRGPGRADAAWIPATDLSSNDVELTAQRMQRLDLIISVDTMACHLAGALGARTWTLLHGHCDWRWGHFGARSVWYPTMRLFRQPYPGDWEPVVDAVASRLRDLARRREQLSLTREASWNE